MISDEAEIYLKEYERLRVEIDSRTVLQHAILAAALAAVGATISVVGNAPEALLGLALLLSYLWVLWLDHALQIFRIAAYLAIVTRKSLLPEASAALSWEWWYRNQLPSLVPIARKTGVDAGRVTIKLFQVGALATLVWYAVDRIQSGLGGWQWLWLVAIAAPLAAHAYVWRWIYSRAWCPSIRQIDALITASLDEQMVQPAAHTPTAGRRARAT